MSYIHPRLNSEKKYILAFKLNINDEIPIRLPKGEAWTLYFTENFLYIGFGRKKDGKYRYNIDAIRSFQRKYVDSEFGLWSVGDDKVLFESNEEAISLQKELYNELRTDTLFDKLYRELQSSDSDEDEFYDSVNKCFYRESEIACRGDSLPIPYKSKKELDKELDDYAKERELKRQI